MKVVAAARHDEYRGKKGVGLYEARRPSQSPSAASRHRDKELPEPRLCVNSCQRRRASVKPMNLRQVCETFFKKREQGKQGNCRMKCRDYVRKESPRPQNKKQENRVLEMRVTARQRSTFVCLISCFSNFSVHTKFFP